MADDDQIYSLALSNYEIPATVDGWLDKGLMAIAGSVTGVEIDYANDQETLRLESDGTSWTLNSSPANQEAVATYVNRFATIRVMNVAEVKPEILTVAQIRIVTSAGEEQLTVSRAAEDSYFLSGGDSEVLYSVATYVAEQLLLTDVDLSDDEEP